MNPENPLQNLGVRIESSLVDWIKLFGESPYLHRTEHSIHLWVAQHLKASLFETPEDARLERTLDNHKVFIERIQKEWPSSEADSGRRGNHDLVILDKNVQFDNFISYKNGFTNQDGSPFIPIEIGLEDGQEHLEKDIKKIRKHPKGGATGFVLHLCRHDFAFKNNRGIEKFRSECRSTAKAYKTEEVEIVETDALSAYLLKIEPNG